MKILHTGDWHIGNFPGPEQNGENARYLDIVKCLDELVESATQEKPDFILVAGDLFHQARTWSDRGLKESRTAIRYIRALSKIAPVVVVRGTPNHDSEQQFAMLKMAFDGDNRVSIFTEPGVKTLYSFNTQMILNVAALPGFDRGVYRAKHPGLSREEETQVFTDELAKIVLGLRGMCQDGTPSVLVTHYTVPGCNMESGQTALFAQYEPVIYPDTLRGADFDLVALGHIHRPQQLEGVRAAFYCGSLTGLNFNDEGQERGFYYHELTWKVNPVRTTIYDCHLAASRFHKTPYREFETIRLTDEDVAAINAGDDSALPPVTKTQGKMVRVLYSCTDEHNKAFNRAALEHWLYGIGGAYWVSEITPEDIAITVSRETLTGDNTPEENLAAYLEEKGKAPEDAARLLERARPIISEAVERTKMEAPTGLFLPLEIEVHNYRNYRDEKFSYADVTFATINGENGAGKSSLFMDAMLDALYEEPREGELTGWICNDPEARSGSIKFTFGLGDKTYRVTRTRQKSGKATLNLAELVDGEWEDRSAEKYKDTQAIIEHTIGMDSLTLKATGLIMQDQYGLFLQADKTDRMTILGSILGLGIYGTMERMSAERATETNRELRWLADTEAEVAKGTENKAAIEFAAKSVEEDRVELAAEIEAGKQAMEDCAENARRANEAGERVAALTSEINTLGEKKRSLEAAHGAQQEVLDQAEALLKEKEAITAGCVEYAALTEREKELLGDMALWSTKLEDRARIQRQMEEARAHKARMEADKTATSASINSYEQALAALPALEEAAGRYETAAAELAAIQKQMEEYQRVTIELSDAVHERNITVASRRAELAKREDTLETLRRRAAMLDDCGCTAENPSCRFLADAIEARDSIAAAEENIAIQKDIVALAEEEAAGKIAELTERKAALECREAYAAKTAEVHDMQAAREQLTYLAAKKERLAALREHLGELDREIAFDADRLKELAEELGAVQEEIDRTEAAAADHAAIIARLEELKAYVEKEKLLPMMEDRKKRAQERQAELDADIITVTLDIGAKGKARDAEIKEAQKGALWKQKLNELRRRSQELTDRLKQKDETVGRYRRQLEEIAQAEARIAELREEAVEQGQLAADYEELKKAFSQDGIPHNIVRTIVPLFEATATNILGQMSAGHMSVEMRMERTLKSNSKKEVTALDIIVNDASTGALPYMSRSGGERVKAALSVILALSEIKSTAAGVQLGFLFIDEPPFLDDKGVQAYCDALEAIQRRYTGLKIMAITHDPEMKARFPQSVDVVKTEAGSKVIFE